MTEADPIVGNWYQRQDKGQKFKVVAVDDDRGFVEIQHFDGDVEEVSRDDWYGLDVEPIEPPEDWTGPLDDVERDDLGYTETEMQSDDWSAPTREWRAPGEEKEEAEEPGDEWAEGQPEEEPREGED